MNDTAFPDPSGSTALAPDELEQMSAGRLSSTIRRALVVVGVLVFGLGGLAATVPITGAVIATGSISVESAVKRIGHPFGGTVADILVEEGTRVAEGEVLMRLDRTVSGASSALTGLGVDQLLALEARLIAERDGESRIRFPAELTARADDPEVAAIMSSEVRNFAVRRQSRAAARAQLARRIEQAEADIVANRSRMRSLERQSALIEEELEQNRALYADRLTTLDRLNALERSAAGLIADSDAATAGIAQAKARIAEARAQAGSVRADARSEAAAELVQVQARIAELKRQQVAADDTNARTEIRSPAAGVVSKLAIRTIGAVVPPGDTIVEVVPDSDELVAEARVIPEDVDQVETGSTATLVLSGLNRQTTPELTGTVELVSPDRLIDSNDMPYFKVVIAIPPEEVARLDDVDLRVGMPVEAYIQTGERTLLSFVTRPLMDQLRRAFRSN